jgi:post-segregation antitoxin (ccd killing protein)
MVTRTVARPVFITTDLDILSQYKAPGVTISALPEGDGKLMITAPDNDAADAAEVWLAEMDTPGH